MWRRYQLTQSFTGRLIGGVPLKTELVRPWLEARRPAEPPVNPTGKMTKTMEQLEMAVIDHLPVEEEIEQVTKGFLRNEQGHLVVSGNTVRAHFKDCANVVKKLLDEKNLKAKLTDRLYVLEDLIEIRKKGEPISSADGFHEHPTHAMTALGPRTSLSRSEYVRNGEIRCTVSVLDDNVITEKILRICLDYGMLHGYGAERSMQEGRYIYELKAI